MTKICILASSGGHFEQALMLKDLKKTYKVILITEKTDYISSDEGTYLLSQVNRKDKFFFAKMIVNLWKSLLIFINEKPDVIISMGALSTIPMFLIAKIMKKKVIFIESFAKTTTPTMTGKFLYNYSDLFIVQWPEMIDIYPKAICLGSIY
ncbi:PssD/Cps14F family polysaccharide biosynthesis glycosyltransferase [Enterococcus sp. N249-2]